MIAAATYIRNLNKDKSGELSGIHEGILRLNMKTDQICVTTTETRQDVKNLNQSVVDIDKRVTILERDLKTAWRKIDDLQEDKSK